MLSWDWAGLGLSVYSYEALLSDTPRHRMFWSAVGAMQNHGGGGRVRGPNHDTNTNSVSIVEMYVLN